jgi:hypothetical protein
MSNTIAYQDYSHIIEALNSAVQRAKNAEPVQMRIEVLRVIGQRDRLVNHSPKYSNQMIHDRAARAMDAANCLVSNFCATPACGCPDGMCSSDSIKCRMTLELVRATHADK